MHQSTDFSVAHKARLAILMTSINYQVSFT